MEQNSNEKVSYEATISRLSQENRALKNQFDDTVLRFEQMEDRVREITDRERHQLDLLEDELKGE